MSNKEFITNLLSIEDIIFGKLFKIPDYQRGYSWDTEQVEDLIKDIEHIGVQAHKHYTGTIVVSADTNSNRYHVIDGQQRLTTLIIILKEIYKIDKSKFSSIYNMFLVRENGEYVLETNIETSHYFKEAIIGNKKNLIEDIKSLQNLKNSKDIRRSHAIVGKKFWKR